MRNNCIKVEADVSTIVLREVSCRLFGIACSCREDKERAFDHVSLLESLTITRCVGFF